MSSPGPNPEEKVEFKVGTRGAEEICRRALGNDSWILWLIIFDLVSSKWWIYLGTCTYRPIVLLQVHEMLQQQDELTSMEMAMKIMDKLRAPVMAARASVT